MNSDFIIIGSGLAGLTSALTLAGHGSVLLISKEKLPDSASSLAQGGIAAAVSETDSFASHIQDTLIAGAWHNKKEAVEFLVHHAPHAITWLEKQGVLFDKKNKHYALGREGAHSYRRILHATDFTGRSIVNALLKQIKANKNIICAEDCFFLDLLVQDNRCYGIQVIKDNNIINYFSRAVILATGGLGQIYRWTTNPKVATGDGIAAGYRAGAKLADLEFIQFHPTALTYGESPLFLLSEAIRGEGAYLVNEKSHRFMEDVHPLKELAPRDIVARAIFQEQKHGNVFLDIRHKGETFLQERFPNTYEHLRKRGFDMAKDLLPVTPAAHYSCGGIVTDTNGKTSTANLFAFGEVSCSGIHGANRLASNSLLEAVVFPLQLSKSLDVLHEKIEKRDFPIPSYIENSNVQTTLMKENLQNLMWEQVGIVRTQQGLLKAQNQLSEWQQSLQEIKEINEQLAELKNMVTAAKLVTEAALQRKNPLGAHYVI